MKYYLIKSINCIVSDETPKEYEPSYSNKMNRIDTGVMSNLAWVEAYPKDLMKIVATNSEIKTATGKILEGLKPFELVDEEAEKLADELFPILAVEENFDSKKSYEMYLGIMETRRVNFIAGYKAKASAFTLQEVYEILGHCWKVTREDEHGVRRFTNGKAATNTDIVADYLQEQDSKLIEVIQISENIFKIKK